MGKNRRIFKRRDFIRTGILGSVALSIPLGRLFFLIDDSSDPGMGEQVNSTWTAQTRVYGIAKKYGAEFGAIKPVIRRHRNGRL
jgi:hypothetical protein